MLLLGVTAACGQDGEQRSPVGPSPTYVEPGQTTGPEAIGRIPWQTVEVGTGTTWVTIGRYFRSRDNTTLAYTVENSDPEAITARVDGQVLELQGHLPRKAELHVVATDAQNRTARQELNYEPVLPVQYKIWSQHGAETGESYEYAVDCYYGGGRVYPTLNSCYLARPTAVRVTTPTGTTYELEKDFNIQTYSGEVTRRWVLYGPPNAGFPPSGLYVFKYYTVDGLEYEESVPYTLRSIDYPTNVQWKREEDDLIVEWTAPRAGEPGMWGKVLLFPESGETISQAYEWGTTTARLEDLPIRQGTRVLLNVMIALYEPPAGAGYAYSRRIPITW